MTQRPQPASRLFDDDLTGRSPKTLVDTLADRHECSFLAAQVMELLATS